MALLQCGGHARRDHDQGVHSVSPQSFGARWLEARACARFVWLEGRCLILSDLD